MYLTIHISPEMTALIKQNMPLYEIYFNRVLFRNFCMCLYHGKTSKRLNCEPPTPEEYAAMGN